MAAAGASMTQRPPPGHAALRLLLFSDLVLDRPYEWAPPSVGDARRAAAREALVELLGLARQHNVDLIACAGDLFDRRTIRPTTMQWLITALRSAGVPVLIAPGNRDFVGPLGGYTRHEWPDNVTVFHTDRLVPVDVTGGVTVWGAAHTEAHRSRSFLDGFEADREGVNLALFHGAEKSGASREPHLDPCAMFDEAAIASGGLDHALVGHYQQPHFGLRHTYPGAPLAHEFGSGAAGGAIVVSIAADGSIDREYIGVATPGLHHVAVDVAGSTSKREVIQRTKTAIGDRGGVIRLCLTGPLSPEIVLKREDFLDFVGSDSDLLIDCDTGVDLDLVQVADEQTVRGQFVRDVLASAHLTDERGKRVLLIGLRALDGSDTLEGPG